MFLFICLFVYLFIFGCCKLTDHNQNWQVCLFVCYVFCLFVCLFICLFVCLFVCFVCLLAVVNSLITIRTGTFVCFFFVCFFIYLFLAVVNSLITIRTGK